MYVRYTSDFQESMIFYMDFLILALGLITIDYGNNILHNTEYKNRQGI